MGVLVGVDVFVGVLVGVGVSVGVGVFEGVKVRIESYLTELMGGTVAVLVGVMLFAALILGKLRHDINPNTMIMKIVENGTSIDFGDRHMQFSIHLGSI